MTKKNLVHRLKSPAEVAQIVGVSKATITDYCRRMERGEISLQRRLRENFGIISVERDAGMWLITIEVKG